MTKVLLVDDDPQVRRMLGETLRQEGLEVTEATSGKEALERYREGPADVVIMDIIMPGQDGVEAIHSLRGEFPEAKIIAVSGGSPNIPGERLLKTASQLGADRAFGKPMEIDLLIQTIRELTSKD